MSAAFKPLPPPVGSGGEPAIWTYLKRIFDVLRGVQAGKLNCTAPITLTPSSTTTTFDDPRIGPESFIDFMPLTAHAATARGGLYVSARSQGSATLTHANTADVDKTFSVIIIG
jgi:hypothetical protein